MNKRIFVTRLFGWVMLGLGGVLLGACDTNSSDQTTTVSFALLHTVGNAPLHNAVGADLAFNEARFVNAAGNTYEITRLEYILTDVALVAEDGSRVELTKAHYANPTMPATLQGASVEAPAGTYTGLSFTFGVVGANNIFGALPNTSDYEGMLWPAVMGGGTDRYHYMRFEGNFVHESGMKGFLVHTGPTGGNDNSVSMVLPLDVEAEGDTWTLNLTMDLNAWFAAPEMYDFREVEAGIMGNQIIQERLRANASHVFNVVPTFADVE